MPGSVTGEKTSSPNLTTVSTLPPRCAMPWTSESFTSRPDAAATFASRSAARIVPWPPTPQSITVVGAHDAPPRSQAGPVCTIASYLQTCTHCPQPTHTLTSMYALRVTSSRPIAGQPSFTHAAALGAGVLIDRVRVALLPDEQRARGPEDDAPTVPRRRSPRERARRRRRGRAGRRRARARTPIDRHERDEVDFAARAVLERDPVDRDCPGGRSSR